MLVLKGIRHVPYNVYVYASLCLFRGMVFVCVFEPVVLEAAVDILHMNG